VLRRRITKRGSRRFRLHATLYDTTEPCHARQYGAGARKFLPSFGHYSPKFVLKTADTWLLSLPLAEQFHDFRVCDDDVRIAL
jgi:hypothetical protein